VPYSPFVSTSGHRLYRHARPYRFLGVNIYGAMHLGATAEAGGDRARLERELDALALLGVRNVRALAASEGPDTESWFARSRDDGWGWSDTTALGRRPTPWRVVPSMQPTPGTYNLGVVAGLDYLVAALARRNMTCVLMLGNMWPWSGGFAQYVEWGDAVSASPSSIPYMPPERGGDWDTFQRYAARFYGSEEAQAAFRAHVHYVLTRRNPLRGQIAYADDPTIMAWELANEPRGMREVGAYSRWLEQTSRLIKSLAPRQLVTTGTEGQTPFPKSYVGVDFRADHALSAVDYATVHIWPQNWEWYSPQSPEATYGRALNRSLTYLRAHLAIAEELGKPLVLEEFGLSRDRNEHANGTPVSWRDRFFTDLLAEVTTQAAANSPLVGANIWAWGGEGRPRRPRAATEPVLLAEHCWRAGDPMLGDPAHEAAGWYSVYDDDLSTHRVLANFSGALAALPTWY
jgi:mannan endo-1,4-beta-mannosidase